MRCINPLQMSGGVLLLGLAFIIVANDFHNVNQLLAQKAFRYYTPPLSVIILSSKFFNITRSANSTKEFEGRNVGGIGGPIISCRF